MVLPEPEGPRIASEEAAGTYPEMFCRMVVSEVGDFDLDSLDRGLRRDRRLLGGGIL